MKLLHITASMDPKLGGVCQALKTMIKGLSAFENTENEVVSFDDPDASFIDKNLIKVNALGAGKGPWFYNASYFNWLFAHLPHFDTVILHGLWNYQGYGLIKAFAQLKKNDPSFSTRLFVMPHGMLDPYFQKAEGRKLKAVRNWLYWKLIEKNVVNLADGLLFTCEAELLLARQTFSPYLPKKELVVGLGVEEPPTATAAMQEVLFNNYTDLKLNPYFLFISRIHQKKGVDLLLSAYQTYIKNQQFQHKSIINTNASFIEQKTKKHALIIAGPGLETPYGQQIYEDAGQLNQTIKNVIFPGMLTGDAKWAAFYNCEAFVLPSHQENFGIAVVEALACGKPVLISNQINIHTEISRENAGFVANDTLEGTNQLLENWSRLSTHEKQEMSKNARKCYEKYFAVAPAAQKLIAAISK